MEERVPRPRTKVIGRLRDAVVEVLQARENRHHHVGDAERDVRNQDRPEPAVDLHRHEQHEKRNANQDVRHDERRVDERMVNRLKTSLPAVERQRGRRPDHARDERRKTRDRQRQPEAVQKRRDGTIPREDLLVPLHREACELPLGVKEAHRDAVRNKPVDDHQQNRHIQKRKHKAQHRHGEEGSFHRCPYLNRLTS